MTTLIQGQALFERISKTKRNLQVKGDMKIGRVFTLLLDLKRKDRVLNFVCIVAPGLSLMMKGKLDFNQKDEFHNFMHLE